MVRMEEEGANGKNQLRKFTLQTGGPVLAFEKRKNRPPV